MKILGTGLSGLVGSRVVELLKDFEFESIVGDVTDKDQITKSIKSSDASWVLHLAAKTNVDGCEEDKINGQEGEAWRVNVTGTENVALACSQYHKKLLYISTDFVFDGEKESGYIEEDEPNPVNWYGTTKYEGEKKVLSSGADYIIARIAYPYRKSFERKDFLRSLIEKIAKGEPLKMVTDHIMTPTFIDDIAKGIKLLMDQDQKGIFHLVGSQPITPYETAMLIAKTFDFDKSKIEKITREEFFKGRARRGYNLYLKNDKIEKLGIKMRTLDEAIREIKT